MRSNFNRYNNVDCIALGTTSAIFLVLICSLLPGCLSRSVKQEKPPVSYAAAHELQARLVDIPFPLDAQMSASTVRETEGGMQWFVECMTMLPISALKTFYHVGMEELGWREDMIFEHEDHPSVVLLFEKPRKICVVMIEQPRGAQRGTIVRYHSAQR